MDNIGHSTFAEGNVGDGDGKWVASDFVRCNFAGRNALLAMKQCCEVPMSKVVPVVLASAPLFVMLTAMFAG